mmetsp:Transcript_70989/g.139486  ORF Transcript_70989/g.139486 Transcript_70989/m.139486 type:complete len:252 (-) Transcript_70989:129-884(-)
MLTAEPWRQEQQERTLFHPRPPTGFLDWTAEKLDTLVLLVVQFQPAAARWGCPRHRCLGLQTETAAALVLVLATAAAAGERGRRRESLLAGLLLRVLWRGGRRKRCGWSALARSWSPRGARAAHSARNPLAATTPTRAPVAPPCGGKSSPRRPRPRPRRLDCQHPLRLPLRHWHRHRWPRCRSRCRRRCRCSLLLLRAAALRGLSRARRRERTPQARRLGAGRAQWRGGPWKPRPSAGIRGRRRRTRRRGW